MTSKEQKKWEQRRKRRDEFVRLFEGNFAESVQKWMGKDSVDPFKVQRDLYISPKRLQRAFATFRGGNDYWSDQIIASVDAMQQLDTPESIETFITASLIDGDAPFRIAQHRDSYDDSAVQQLRNSIYKMTEFDDTTDEQRESVLKLIDAWDQATLSIMSNQELYHTLTRSGRNSHTDDEEGGVIADYVGTLIISINPLTTSPLAEDGRYYEPVKDAILLDDIVSGKLTKDADFNEWYRQNNFLDMLPELQKEGEEPDYAFWNAIKESPHFIQASHNAAVRYGFDDANDLLCKALAAAWNELEQNESLYRWQTHHVLHNHFEGKTEYDKFRAKRTEEMNEIFGNDIEYGGSGLKIPEYDALVGNNFVVLTGFYEAANADGCRWYVDYTVVGPNMYEEKEAVIHKETDETIGVTDDLKAAVIDLARKHAQFLESYDEELSKY